MIMMITPQPPLNSASELRDRDLAQIHKTVKYRDLNTSGVEHNQDQCRKCCMCDDTMKVKHNQDQQGKVCVMIR